MKTGKKLLALLLAVVMTMSLLTVGAFAEETPSSETPLEQQDSGSGNIPDDPAHALTRDDGGNLYPISGDGLIRPGYNRFGYGKCCQDALGMPRG